MENKAETKNRIKFLGTAGARYVMARQLRYSAGTYLYLEGQKIILDPGPGTLLRCADCHPPIDTARLDAILLSHAHIDHSGDLNALTDAMTCGGWERRGTLFLPRDCFYGKNKVLLNYIKKGPNSIKTLSAETEYDLENLSFKTTGKLHHDMETYGFKFQLREGVVGFVTDTLYFDQLPDLYAGTRWLIINVVRQTGHTGRKLKHLSLGDAEKLIDAIKPELTVLTHFGMSLLKQDPEEMARNISKKLNSDVRAAHDGMELELP